MACLICILNSLVSHSVENGLQESRGGGKDLANCLILGTSWSWALGGQGGVRVDSLGSGVDTRSVVCISTR